MAPHKPRLSRLLVCAIVCVSQFVLAVVQDGQINQRAGLEKYAERGDLLLNESCATSNSWSTQLERDVSDGESDED